MKKFVSILLLLVLSLGTISASAATMYALDGRTAWVDDSQISAWEAVGWYTYEDIIYKEVQSKYHACKNVNDYWGMMRLVDDYINVLAGTKHEQSLYAIRTEGIDLWRNACGAPLAMYQYAFEVVNGYDPEIVFNLVNVSYKDIQSYEIQFTFYTSTGQSGQMTLRSSSDGQINIAKAAIGVGSDLSNIPGARRITTPVVTKVTFTDGTVWYR